MKGMIRIFSRKNKQIPKKVLREFIDFYEKRYFYFSEIKDYEKRKKELLSRKSVSIVQFTEWMRENYPKDCYTKCSIQPVLKNKNRLVCSRRMYGEVLYIQLYAFSSETVQEMERAMETAAKYLVLDLRDNCGGAVEALVRCIGLFIQADNAFEIRCSNSVTTYNSTGKGVDYKKIFLLVNGNTMSCAEILMMVLYKNMKNVFIIGGPTFLKEKGQITVKKGKIVLSVTNFLWFVRKESVSEFWENSRERILSRNEELNFYKIMELVYSNL